MELNYQELKRDVEKQRQKETEEKNKKEAQQILFKNIQELNQLVQKQLLHNIAQKAKLQETLKKHNEFETKICMVPIVNNVAFKR